MTCNTTITRTDCFHGNHNSQYLEVTHYKFTKCCVHRFNLCTIIPSMLMVMAKLQKWGVFGSHPHQLFLDLQVFCFSPLFAFSICFINSWVERRWSVPPMYHFWTHLIFRLFQVYLWITKIWSTASTSRILKQNDKPLATGID